jgi:glycosyltransferase involved in cell wall biosynthesis
LTSSAKGDPGSDSPDPDIEYSLVIPVYRNAESVDDLLTRVVFLSSKLAHAFEVILVLDGSPDNSKALIETRLARELLHAQVIEHSRNFGAFAAIKSGLQAARGRVIAVMAADLQEPIELVEEFYAHLATGQWDVAVGTRISRQDPGLSKAMASGYWGAYRRLVQPTMPPGGVDVFACTSDVAKQLLALRESNSSLVGLLFWLGFRRIEIPYHRAERKHGKSAWSMRKKMAYLSDSVFSFTSIPITVMLTVGIIGSLASLIYAIAIFLAWLAGGIVVAGFTALMVVLLFSTSSTLAGLGVVGTYVWRAFENTKQRPYSVVMEVKVFSP